MKDTQSIGRKLLKVDEGAYLASHDKLKPCPFCGGEAEVHLNDGWEVMCKQCGTFIAPYLGKAADDKQKHIDFWNDRCEPAIPKKVEPPLDRIVGYRTGICKGCTWHPNVCDYCELSLHPANNAGEDETIEPICTCNAKPEHMGEGRYGKWHDYNCPMFDGDHPEICEEEQ